MGSPEPQLPDDRVRARSRPARSCAAGASAPTIARRCRWAGQLACLDVGGWMGSRPGGAAPSSSRLRLLEAAALFRPPPRAWPPSPASAVTLAPSSFPPSGHQFGHVHSAGLTKLTRAPLSSATALVSSGRPPSFPSLRPSPRPRWSSSGTSTAACCTARTPRRRARAWRCTARPTGGSSSRWGRPLAPAQLVGQPACHHNTFTFAGSEDNMPAPDAAPSPHGRPRIAQTSPALPFRSARAGECHAAARRVPPRPPPAPRPAAAV
jgi:hypothetical protein